jgi:predicted DNA-binding transcriptional regulator AlpA
VSNNATQTALASEKDFLDEKQLLTRIPISRRTAFNWIQQRKLPCVKIGRRKLFHWPSVEAALLRQQRGAQ